MKDRSDEKERLWKEVLGSPRAYESTESGEIKLENAPAKDGNKKSSDSFSSILKQADRAMDELNRILQRQKTDIEDMQKKEEAHTDINPDTLAEIDRLQKDLETDYGVKEAPAEKIPDAKVFEEVQKALGIEVLGQSEAIRQLTVAFRRPYVMGYEKGNAKNVILVSGPHGSGKHTALSKLTRALYERQIFISDEVVTIDMSRYTSASQEGVFLQDLYSALNGNGSVVCFEKFDSAFPGFLRMIDDLVVNGSVVLNKRYVVSKGVLVENQTGLVKEAIDSLRANDKYFVFITSKSSSDVQDAFGADFMYHVLDSITFRALDENSVAAYIQKESDDMQKKSESQLKVKLNMDESIRSWVHTHYDKTRGTDSIHGIFYDFYVSLSQLVLNEGLGSNEVIETKVIDDVPYALYQDLKQKLYREKNSAEEIEAVNKQLDEIVGLQMVKEYIQGLQSHIAMQQKRREQGMKTAEISKHMIFTGNPGTGKTTIARLLARYMKAIGALKEGQLVEVTRADLVAQYVGQTAPLTMSVIKSALGGILFIDEAYSLYRGKDDSFGLEAIDTLVKAMEDHRDDFIVVLAGYKKEMASFLEANSGLKSRFPNLIDFPDYTGAELLKIATFQAKGKGYEIAEDVKGEMETYFDEVQSINPSEAGNGRLARNLVEEAILNQSKRLVKDNDSDLSTLKKEDFNFTIKVKPQ